MDKNGGVSMKKQMAKRTKSKYKEKTRNLIWVNYCHKYIKCRTTAL